MSRLAFLLAKRYVLSGLPSGLVLSDVAYSSSDAQSTGTWTLSGKALVAPGTYVINFKVTDKDNGFTTKDLTITVTKEDARVTYTGSYYVSTPSVNVNTATVELTNEMFHKLLSIMGYKLNLID